jgi:CTP:phosphocholine cytidylyltransferase-like protein
MPLICKSHGYVHGEATSPALWQFIEDQTTVLPKDFRIIRVEIDSLAEYGRVSSYYFDYEYARHFLEIGKTDLVLLRNRSKAEKKLHDRITINKLFRLTKHVCPQCLKALISVKK